jgi:hypothetical protein
MVSERASGQGKLRFFPPLRCDTAEVRNKAVANKYLFIMPQGRKRAAYVAQDTRTISSYHLVLVLITV